MSENKDILIVDDLPENLHLLSQILKDKNYKVRALPSGKLVIKAIENSIPDMILLDVTMPEINGYEVCKMIKEKYKDIPVIFISALNDTFDKIKGFNAGGVDYITKPFQVEEVYSRIKIHLELKDAKEEIQTLLTKTLTGSIKMMTELLSNARPEVFAQATRLKRYAQKMNEKLFIFDGYKTELAAMLSVIGFVTLPEVVIEKKYSGKILSVEEKLLNDSALLFGADLIKNIPRMEDIAEMIVPTKDIKIGSDRRKISGRDILDVIVDYDNNLLLEEVSESAINKMMQKKSKYNQIVLDTFIEYIRKECEEKIKRVYINDLKAGMIILEDIVTSKNIKVVPKNTTVTSHTLSLILYYTSKDSLPDFVKVKEIRG
jgi:DNA-binding response OmpR family regulator